MNVQHSAKRFGSLLKAGAALLILWVMVFAPAVRPLAFIAELHDPSQGPSLLSRLASEGVRAASVPALDDSMSWTFDYDTVDDRGTSHTGTETHSVVGVQDINLGGFEYEAYRLELSGSEDFSSGEYSGTTTFSGRIFVRTADLALIKTEKSSTSQIEGVPTEREAEILTIYQPPRMDYKFPLEKSKTWSANTHRTVRTVETIDGETQSPNVEEKDLSYRYWVRDRENVTVSGNTFSTYSVRRSDTENMQNYTQYWYCPDLSHVVKEEEWRSGAGGPEKKGERTIADWSRNHPPRAVIPESNVSFREDERKTLDLHDLFEDPDGDPMAFSYEENTVLGVSLDSGKATLKAPPDWWGNDTVMFSASDGRAEKNATARINVTVRPVNDPPVLEDGGVAPGNGTGDTAFTFSVTYSDAEGDEPGNAAVFIDGERRSMDVPGEGNWKEGSVLGLSAVLSPGSHEYYFLASDGTNTTRLPVRGSLQGPVVEPDDRPPVLYGGNCSPPEGDTDTEFTFEVWYRDPDGDPARNCSVLIDDTEYPMTEDNGTWLKGKRFVFTAVLVPGNHTYFFTGDDGKSAVRNPVQGYLSGPEVVRYENNKPILRYGEAVRKEGEGNVIVFSIIYLDLDGDKPSAARLILDGEEYDMTADGTGLSEGELYSLEIALEAGEHGYYFRFGDGKEETRYPPYGERTIFVEDEEGSGGGTSSGRNTGLVPTWALIAGAAAAVILLVLWISSRRRKEGKERGATFQVVDTAEEEEGLVEVTPLVEDEERGAE